MSIDNAIRPTGNAADRTVPYARPAAPTFDAAQQYGYGAGMPTGARTYGLATGLPGYGPTRTPPPGPPQPAPAARGPRRLIAALVAVLLLAAAGLGAFLLLRHATVDPAAVTKEIIRITEQTDRITPTGIRCPDDVPFEKGRTFTCTATLLGKPATYTITQNDDEGAITIAYTRPFVDPAAAAQQISTATTSEVGIEPKAVQCPSDVPLEKGGTFTCSATLDGQALDFQLTQTDGEGAVSIAHDRVLSAKEVGDKLAAQLTQEVGEQIVAVCGTKGQTVIVNAPGQPISCAAANAANPSRNAQVTVSVDARGILTFTIQ